MRAGSVLAAYLHPATEIQHSFHVSVMGVANHDAANHQRLFASSGPLMMRAGTGGLVDARNQVMAHFLDQAQEEWLWMVDTDMGFPANVVDLLVDAADPTERPVVGALCFGLKLLDPDGYGGYLNEPFPTIYGWQAEGPDGYPGFARADDYPRDVLLRVAGTGAACLLIHRTVGEKLRAEHGDNWFSPVRYPDGRFVSEDLSFCYRLGQGDIPLFVHTGIRTTHAKQLWLGEREWLAHLALTRLGEAVGEQVDGELVEMDGEPGPTVNVDTGVVTPAGEPLPELVSADG